MADLQNFIPGLGRGLTVGSGDMDPQVQQFTSVPITSAQILALNTTPVTILPAPAANTAIVVTDAVLDVNSGTAYAAGGTVGLYYGFGTTNFIAGAISKTFTATTGSTVYMAANPANIIPVITGTSIVLAQQSSTAFTTGNETATVNIWYAVINTGH